MVEKLVRKLKRYCKTYWEIENYQEAVNDQVNIWDLHHKDEIDLNKTKAELIELGLYYDCKPERLIFIKHGEHIGLHMNGNKIRKNRDPWNKGKEDKKICPLILWKLRKIDKLSWKKIGIQLNICTMSAYNKFKKYNLDNYNL